MGKTEDLIEAARAGNYPMVERILRWGTAGNVTFSSQLLLRSIKPKKAGPFASLRRVQGGIGSRDSNGYTALHYASLNGHKEVVELLPYIMKIQYNMYLYFNTKLETSAKFDILQLTFHMKSLMISIYILLCN